MVDGSSVGIAIGATVGSGCCRQTGMFGLGVGVWFTGAAVSTGFVGSGCGGTRGSGKRGSGTAVSVIERFQSAP
jgi:hypothetical protein